MICVVVFVVFLLVILICFNDTVTQVGGFNDAEMRHQPGWEGLPVFFGWTAQPLRVGQGAWLPLSHSNQCPGCDDHRKVPYF